jgi:hypothetical protein
MPGWTFFLPGLSLVRQASQSQEATASAAQDAARDKSLAESHTGIPFSWAVLPFEEAGVQPPKGESNPDDS